MSRPQTVLAVGNADILDSGRRPASTAFAVRIAVARL